ncbi:hypothetical protein L1887_18370 [Cichorium endivia]|nr:hypothetical protein L1887_18370 [Cichorium endivia]
MTHGLSGQPDVSLIGQPVTRAVPVLPNDSQALPVLSDGSQAIPFRLDIYSIYNNKHGSNPYKYHNRCSCFRIPVVVN